MLLVSALVDWLKYKLVGDVIVLACWSPVDQIKYTQLLNNQGLSVTFSCDGKTLDRITDFRFTGVLYFMNNNDFLLQEVQTVYFASWYKWIIVGDTIPERLNSVRYDADMVLFNTDNTLILSAEINESLNIYDIYYHPRDGASTYPWAVWTTTSHLQILWEQERNLRRLDLKGQDIEIAAPMGHYVESKYNETYLDYIKDDRTPEKDSALHCGYGAATILVQRLNATEIIEEVLLWAMETNNSSMIIRLRSGQSDIGSGILRVMTDRLQKLDYIMPLWPFSVGFTYVSERESSSNMFVEPFTSGVWWTCLIIALILAVAQRITSRTLVEKEGAYIAVLATWLQQDASAVPDGISGRWTFLVLSVSSMLVHAYYTSAIVSTLMSAGTSGPETLESLADSRYAIASEDYDYIRGHMFDVKTNWKEIEYLKKMKMTSNFYQDTNTGVRLIQEGNTAFHTEYNHIYPHLRYFSDDQICKLKFVDTIPEVTTWLTTTKRGQWTFVLRPAGDWLLETGMAKRELSKWHLKPPQCRASLLAERVKFGDIASVVKLFILGVFASIALLGLEIFYAKWRKKIVKRKIFVEMEVENVPLE